MYKRQHNRLVVEYALRDMSKPMGVAQYRLTQALPEHCLLYTSQRPSKFDGRIRPIPRVNHCNPMIARGGDINRRVHGSSRGNELEIRKALDDFAGQRGPLAHDANDIKRQQPLNQGVRIGDVVLKYGCLLYTSRCV